MKKIEVSLLVTTAKLRLAEISSRLGCPYSSGSHEKGAPRLTGAPFDQTIWRLSPAKASAQTLKEQFEKIASHLQPDAFSRLGVLPDDAEVYFDIAIYFDTPMASLSIPLVCLTTAQRYSADIEVTCYPSDFGSASKETKKRSKREKSRGQVSGRSSRRS
ncbi:MAG: hypothetical protein KAY09_03490 [Nitrospira sp.]|nr:hypothetical protein [Nitrospira sp.]